MNNLLGKIKKKSFDLSGNRTHDLLIRSTITQPTELRSQTEKLGDDLGGESRQRLFKVIKACGIDQRTRLSISWCLKSFFARCRMQFDAETQGDSLDRFSHEVIDKWSFLRLKFLQIPLLTVCWVTELDLLSQKLRQVLTGRNNEQVNRLQRISHLSKGEVR